MSSASEKEDDSSDMIGELKALPEDVCANCGKELGNISNICNTCLSVKYCNASCKKRHRSHHKKKCRRHVAEFCDEILFREPPKEEDCPICMIRLPKLGRGSRYYQCCGKAICCGCIHADALLRMSMLKKCPFCRTTMVTTNEEALAQVRKRIELNDAEAMYNYGCYHNNGLHGLSRDFDKALEFWYRAAELGYAQANFSLGHAYDVGQGVEKDGVKASYYCLVAALMGDEDARNRIGYSEGQKGNWDRAIKHWLIAAGSGADVSVNNIRKAYLEGRAAKDDYAKALRSHQAYLDGIKSDQRDKAAAFCDEFKYY